MRAILIALAVMVSGAAWAAPIEAKFAGNNPTSLTGLSDENGCFPGKISGRVVKREFDDGAIKMKAVIIEDRSGERNYINIDTDKIAKASAAEAGNAIRGLQVLLKEGSSVQTRVFACGAAGRVMMLDSVQRAR